MSSTLASRCMAAYAATLFSEPYSANPSLSDSIDYLPEELRDKFRILHQYFMQYDITITETIYPIGQAKQETIVGTLYENPRVNFSKKLYPQKDDFTSYDKDVFCLFLRCIAETTTKNDEDILRQAAVFDDIALYKKIYFRTFHGNEELLAHVENSGLWAKFNESQKVLNFLKEEKIDYFENNSQRKLGKCLYFKSITHEAEKEGTIVKMQRRYEKTGDVETKEYSRPLSRQF